MIQHKQNVVLTGGIASGKTLMSDALGKMSANVIDTDVIARLLLEENGSALSNEAVMKVKEVFGGSVLTNNSIDRKKLRSLIFNDDLAKHQLESILHPLIFKEVQRQMMSQVGKYNLIVVPLLDKNSPYVKLADKILVAEVSPAVQLERVMARDCIDEALALKIIASQASNGERRSLADTIIINTNGYHTRNVLKQLDKQYSLASF